MIITYLVFEIIKMCKLNHFIENNFQIQIKIMFIYCPIMIAEKRSIPESPEINNKYLLIQMYYVFYI